MGAIHVCRTTAYDTRAIRHCPTCDTRRRMVASHAIWYGWTLTCCTCGDAWSDGERLPRPFAPRWRTKEAAKAKARWSAAMTKEACMRALIEAYNP